MNSTQAYLILGMIYAFVALEAFFVVYWLRKNCILLSINERIQGAYINRNVRVRDFSRKLWQLGEDFYTKPVEGGEPVLVYGYYSMWDIFKRKPYFINYGKEREIVTEGGFLGIKRTIKAVIDETGAQAYTINKELPEGSEIRLIMNSWVNTARHELYDETKPQLSKAEIFAQIAIPMGMVIVAVAAMIFFPKMYAAVLESGNQAVKAVAQPLAEKVKELIPLG